MNNEKQSSSSDTEKKKTPLFLYGVIAIFVVVISFLAFGEKEEITNVPVKRTASSKDLPPQIQIVAIKKHLAEHPEDAKWWAELANLYSSVWQSPEAIEAYEKYLNLIPDDVEVLIKLGMMYKGSQQPDKALAAFDKVIALQPGNETALFNKGAIYLYEFNNRAETLKAWQTILSNSPDAKAPNGVPLKNMVSQVKIGMPYTTTPGQ